MDVWGPARVRGQGHERYFLLVVDDYSHYTTVFPLRSKGDVTEVLIDWIRAARLHLRESFGSAFPVLRLHSDRGGEFSSARLGAFCRAQGIRQTFSLPASPQQNGIAERRIGMVMDVAQTSPTLRWTGKVGDASAFRVWGSWAFLRDLSADKLSPRVVPCVFLGFPPDAPGWQFYHPTSRRVLSSQDVTFDESVPYYRLFPYRTAPLPPPPLFLAPGPPPVEPLPPLGPAPSGVSPVDAVEPVEVAIDSSAARGAEPAGAGSGGAEPGGAEPVGAEPGGAEPRGTESGGAEPGGAEPGGAEPGGVEPGGAGSTRVASRGTSSRRELLSPQELRDWFARCWSRAAGAGGTTVAAGPRGTHTGGTGAAGTGGAAGAAGVGPAGGTAGATGGTGAAGPAGVGAAGAAGAGAAGGVGAGGSAGAGASEGAGVGAVGARGATGAGAAAGGTGAVPAGSGGAARPRPYFVLLLEQVLGLPPSAGPAPPLACPQPVQAQSQLQPASPLPAPSPYTGPSGGLAERRKPASRPASPVRAACTIRRAPRPRPPAVLGTHQMALRPSTAPQRVPLPSPPESSLPVLADPESESLRAASPTVPLLLATVVIDPSFESTAASALVAELVDFSARCRLDYAASLVAESESVFPPSVRGECALSTDVLEDRQEEFQCFAAALPHLVSTLLAPEGDPDAPDISTPRSYAEAITGPYSSQWQAAMDAEMASWKSTGTYVDEVPPPGANIVNGMWIFRVKRPPGSPPVFKALYLARGFSQRQRVDYFQTFSPTPKMTTLRVLLHVAAQRHYELHSLDFSTAFLQGSLHEEIWLRRPPGFTGSFPSGTQWSLRRPVYGLRQAPREWHDTLRTTLAALGFAPSTADPSLFLRSDTSLPPFYILVYVDDLVFATADAAGLAHMKSELQKRHTCTDLGELRSYLGLQITRDRAQRTITLTQSHMVQQVLQGFDFTYSSPQATPLSTRHSLSALPSDESVEPSGPYPELVGCLMYLMTCTRPDLAYPLSILAHYVAPGRHRPEHMAAAKRVLRYLCSTSGLGLVLGGRSPVVLTGHADASWLRWLTYLLTDLGEPPRSPPVLYVDNKAMLALCREDRVEHRTKHIALRYFFARELQQRGQLRLAYVASQANTADIFTKALQPCDHQRFCTMLEELYMLQPEGLDDGSGRVCRLKKAIYGLKQAPRAWYHKLEETLLAGGFKKSECDHSLFLLQEKEHFLMLLVYVDDILLFSKSSAMIERVEEMLEMQFKCSKMGDVKYYLGMHVERDLEKGVLRLHQRKYCEGLPEKYGLQDGGKLATRLPSGFTVEPCADEEVVGESDRKLFHSMVGALNYAANHTRPDIAFATSRLASVVSRPSHEQLEAAKRLVRYVSATASVGLEYSAVRQRLQRGAADLGKGEMLLTCYTDASFNSVKADGTSIGGYVCLFGGGAFSWRSKKQNEVGQSSCETEYMALHHGAKEVVWLRRLLEEIGVCQKEPTVIFCDNESAVKLAKNACLHGLTKHIRPKWHWVRRLLDKEVRLEIVKTHQQAADILTKRLAENEHWKGMKLAGMSVH
ncbi:unnamed protein product [Closterium sp. NIES-53]